MLHPVNPFNYVNGKREFSAWLRTIWLAANHIPPPPPTPKAASMGGGHLALFREVTQYHNKNAENGIFYKPKEDPHRLKIGVFHGHHYDKC